MKKMCRQKKQKKYYAINLSPKENRKKIMTQKRDIKHNNKKHL